MAALPEDVVQAIGRFAAASTPRVCGDLAEALLAADRVSAQGIADIAGRFRGPEVRSAVVALLESWRRVPQAIPPVLLASALQAASTTAECMRTESRSELVWSGPVPERAVLRRTDETLLELVRASRDQLTIVTFAAYRVPELRAALTEAVSRGVEVRFISESHDSSGGRLTHDAAGSLGPELEGRIVCYEWPLERRTRNDRGQTGVLHAKCALADRSALLVASANLTEHALDLNMEMGVLIRGGPLPEQAARHIDALIREGVLQPAL
jgi:phosphatidylserine/phosphatidylglycerophosphate/cardiolipin synthase-like enzyme